MYTPSSTCSSVSASSRYGPMRQYCSGGSSIWSSIQPLPGVWSNGWLRKNANRPPSRSTRATSRDRAVDVVDVLEHEARDDAVERARPGTAAARPLPRAYCGPPPRSVATLSWLRVGSIPTTWAPRPASIRLICPSPHPDVEDHRRRRQFLVDERQDLFDVLGVGALGEPLDPPAGVLLPQLAGRVA